MATKKIKKTKIVLDLKDALTTEEFFLNSAIDKINNGALTTEEADALIEFASVQGARKLLSYMFDLNNAVVLTDVYTPGEYDIERLWVSLVQDNDTSVKNTVKKQNIFKRIWNKIFK